MIQYNGMRKILRLFPIFLFAALLMAATLIFAMPLGVAHAATPTFKIVCKSETEWELYLSAAGNDTLIESASGDFFDATLDRVAGDVLMDALHAWLEENGFARQDYELSFALPGFTAAEHGNNVIAYSHLYDGDYSLSAQVTSVINPSVGTSSMHGALQYRLADSQGYANGGNYHGRSENVGDPIFFGSVDVGKYFVRYAAFENFRFDEREYSVPRFSDNEFDCEVVRATAPAPSISQTTIVYGTAAKNIAIADAAGRWTLSQNQPSGISPETYLEVSDLPVTVNFDFTSFDKNYLTRENIPLEVYVTPRLLRVYVGDAYSLRGEPMADLTKLEHMTDTLVEGDTEEDLGLEFYITPEFSKDVAGTYSIFARISNKNYTCYNVSMHHSSIPCGQYIVYEYKYEAAATDGRRFTVYCDSVRDVTLSVELCEQSIQIAANDVPEGAEDRYFQSVAIYLIRFYDSLGNVTIPSGGCVVEWQDAPSGTKYIAISAESALEDIAVENLAEYDGATNTVTLAAGEDAIAFFADVTVYPPENVWQWYNILLLTLCIALVSTLCALAICVAIRRRRIW